MVQVIINVKQWGNNLGVRLPAAIANTLHLYANQQVCMTVEDKRVIITPIIQEESTLAAKLAQFDRVKHSGEVMITQPVGREIC
ncbi:MAG: AbrB/MazE/SpoVT family DNA-binding domain-containing protein [Pseudomonadota bacterium]